MKSNFCGTYGVDDDGHEFSIGKVEGIRIYLVSMSAVVREPVSAGGYIIIRIKRKSLDGSVSEIGSGIDIYDASSIGDRLTEPGGTAEDGDEILVSVSVHGGATTGKVDLYLEWEWEL